MSPARAKCKAMLEKYYQDVPTTDDHYKTMIFNYVSRDKVVLDAGCGRHLEFAKLVSPYAKAVIAADVTNDLAPWAEPKPGIVVCFDLSAMAVANKTIDLIICRSVFEHLTDPAAVLREFTRILKPGGHIIFRTPNLYDYVSMVSMATPHRLHQWLLNRLLKWDEDDIFPTAYRMNTTHKIQRLMQEAGFACVELKLVSHYPAYLMFSPLIFRLGIMFESLIRKYEALRWLRGCIVGVFKKA